MHIRDLVFLGLLLAAACSGGTAAQPSRDAGTDAAPDADSDAVSPDAGNDAWRPTDIDCTSIPMTIPEEWRACESDGDCTIGFDDRDCSAWWVLGIGKASLATFEATQHHCADTVPGFTGCRGMPITHTDDGASFRDPFVGATCEHGRCTSHSLATATSCEDHAACPGDSLCLSDPCHSPPCPGNGYSPVCRVCGSEPPCHCGYFLAFERCANQSDCATASCGCDDCACTPPCIHGFCAPETGDTTLPFCSR